MPKTAPGLALALITAAGCHQPQVNVARYLVPQAELCEAEYQLVFQAANDVLRKHRFRLDQTDLRTGRITTYHVGSRHFFEFWRQDVATAYDAWEATLTSIRRRAAVEIRSAPAGAGCRVAVTVEKQRFSTPERQVTNSAAAAHYLGRTLPTFATGKPLQPQDSYWIDLGRDPEMERILRKEILLLATHRSFVTPPSTD